jgi:eukaryotic-like serine/threonine-protein kinase
MSAEIDAADPPAIPPPAVAPHPRRMLDRYEIIAEIARGGMGTVLLARLEGAGGFERLLAIKLMHEHLAQDAQFVAMLLDEARTAACIHHPNAVGIVDVAESEVGYYLVMSYVEGFTLAQLLAHPELSAKDRIRFGLRAIVDAAHGLHAAHTAKDAQGRPLSIVHRDVSPQNVLLGLDGLARIADFGIALAVSRMSSSRPGVLKGKPAYMAPEQARGEVADPRADVFALGIMAWEVVIGEPLFLAELDLATLMKVMNAQIETPSKKQPLVKPVLDAAIMKALERKKEDRTPDARSFALSLEKAAESTGLIAPAHELADAIGKLFEEAIKARQGAIRHHLAASSGEKKPLLPGQLGLVPKLYDRMPARRSQSVDKRESTSGVRERDDIDPTGRTQQSIAPTPKTARIDTGPDPIAQPTPPAPEKKSVLPMLLGGLLVLAIAIGVGTWAYTARRGGVESPPARAIEPEPREIATPPDRPPPIEAGENEEAEVDIAPEPDVAPRVEPAIAVEPERGAEPEGRPAQTRPRQRRPRETEEGEPPGDPRTPAFENNPYLTH